MCNVNCKYFAAKIIDIEAEGLVCDFCAQSIEKVFIETTSVAVVYVNLDRGVTFK